MSHLQNASGSPTIPLFEVSKCETKRVIEYSQAAWHNFFMGSLGGSAAFTGLLFVAISIIFSKS